MPAKGKTAPRRARPSLKAKQAAKAERELAKLKRQEAQDAALQAKLDEAKQAIEQLIATDVEVRRADAAARRPPQVVDYCTANGIPLDTPYHPKYNAVGIPPEVDTQTLESVLFGASWPTENGGLGGFGHLKNFINITWPWIEWNPWFEQSLRVLADDDYATYIGETKLRFVSLTGPGSASKSFASGVFACAYFMVDWFRRGDPRTSITLTSTSKGIISQRVWPVIQRCYQEAIRNDELNEPTRFKWGHMVDSQKTVMAYRRDGSKDAKHSIIAMAVESGELSKAVDKIKGRHTERMMLIVDEANSTPQAIFDCIPNMLTSVRELIVLVIGNALSRLDPHGQCCEPVHGWRSITIEDTQWDTKGVAKWGIGPGTCLHFDGSKSPNVLAGRTLYKHIYSYERWQHVQRMGEEYVNTLQHWSQDRGFWPPDGISTTVFSEAMVISHDGTGSFSWLSTPRPCASLDPAFGGDNCVLQFGLLGDIPGGRRALQLTEFQLVPFDPSSSDPIDLQIARYVIAKCKLKGIEPQLFGLDSTGTGRGVAAFMSHLWSPRIKSIEFGGAASLLPASLADPRPGSEIYSNRVTELYYTSREMLLADQLKGLHQKAIAEFCSRVYEYTNKRYKLEPKGDMKLRLGYSPDFADAVAVLCDVARQNGVVISPTLRRLREPEEDVATTDVLNTDYTQEYPFENYVEVT